MFKEAKCFSASPSVILTIPTTPRSKMLGFPLLSSCDSSVPPPIHSIFIIKTSEWWSKSFSCAKGEKPRLSFCLKIISGNRFITPLIPWYVSLGCCCPVAKSCLTFCDPMDCSTPGFPVLHYLSEFAQTHVHWVSDAFSHLVLCCPLLLLLLILPSIRVFYSEPALPIRWPKYWSFSFSISPSSEYSGLISFRTDWFNLLEVQGILKSLLSLGYSFQIVNKTPKSHTLFSSSGSR